MRRYVGWEEVVVSKEKGRREVQYYLKRREGAWDLAVVGKERTPRHMSYNYALPKPHSSHRLKLKSRRDVLNWLSSMLSDLPSQASSPSLGSSSVTDCSLDSDITATKNPHMKKVVSHLKEFVWLGSPWTCRKRRKHYQSFSRNGINISVHDFVYVLAEENKRLVAHLEDLYEDSRGRKMVLVRWFHKTDEVGLVLPPNFNDREIFFSLCLQDLSVECIDGLAVILSPQHFKKYLNEATHTLWEPFVCHRLFHDGDLSAFDITQVPGYWKQEMLRCMYTAPTINHSNSKLDDDGLVVDSDDEDRPSKKQCRSESKNLVQHQNKRGVKEEADVDIQKYSTGFVSSCKADICGLKDGKPFDLSGKELIKQIHNQQLTANCHVEVLSQDSGIRGCWFRAMVMKRHKDKVKVRYQDIKDAENEANCLEEWVLASKIALPDELGIRVFDRTTIRPKPSYCEGQVPLDLVDAGTIVDAWWNDGWWEGIVLCKESEDRIHVYFPGEGKLSIFGCGELRLSRDWVSNQWNPVKSRPDLISSILSRLETNKGVGKCSGNTVQHLVCDNGQLGNISSLPIDESPTCSVTQDDDKMEVNDNIPDLTRDGLLTQIKWNSSRKRGRNREPSRRSGSSQNFDGRSSSSSSNRECMKFAPGHGRYSIPTSLNAEHDKCNYRGDTFLRASVPPLARLVMSR